MKLLDYFFYVLAHRGESDNNYDDRFGWGFLGLWCSLTVATLISTVGLIFGDRIPNSVVRVAIPAVLIVIALIIILLPFRYWTDKQYRRISQWHDSLSKTKRRMLYITFLILFWSMPAAAFVTMRLCLYGHVRWW